MNSIQILSFERNDAGQPTVYHCLVAGREKSLSRKQLLDAIEMVLPEGPPAAQPASTRPAYVANGG